MALSLFFSSRQTSSTLRIRLTSALMKINSPSGFSCRHFAAIRAAASWERPMKYARGDCADRANSVKAASPIPFVAPTKTATRPAGSVLDTFAFDDCTSGKETILEDRVRWWTQDAPRYITTRSTFSKRIEHGSEYCIYIMAIQAPCS
jgi:hypothetical protein